MTKPVSFLQDESGTTAIEYAVLATLLGVALLGVISTLASSVGQLFDKVGGAM